MSNSENIENSVINLNQMSQGRKAPARKNAVISPEVRERIINLYLENYNPAYIARILSQKSGTVAAIIRKFNRTGVVAADARGGDRRSKLDSEMKKAVCDWVDNDCLVTLKELKKRIQSTYNLSVSTSCIDRCLRAFHYTIKRVVAIPAARSRESTIESRFDYATRFRELQQNFPTKSFLFLDEVGFSVSTRPKGSLSGARATTSVQYSKSRNISVVAVMNSENMIFYKILDKAVKAKDFQQCLTEVTERCNNLGVENPILILDNCRIHHARILNWNDFQVLYLPPYCPFLNPIENCFSKWKNAVIRSKCTSKEQLKEAIRKGFEQITSKDCEGFYRNMLKYLHMSYDRLTINN